MLFMMCSCEVLCELVVLLLVLLKILVVMMMFLCGIFRFFSVWLVMVLDWFLE